MPCGRFLSNGTRKHWCAATAGAGHSSLSWGRSLIPVLGPSPCCTPGAAHYTAKRKVHLSPEQCSDFYSDQYGKMFFPSLTAYMSSGPIIALELTRHNAIHSWRELMGPSNSLKAKETHPDSLRAIYGIDDLRNAVHGSNCFTSAEREIRFMFPHVTIEPVPAGETAKDYLNLFVNPTLLSGLTELCKQKPADPYLWLADWLLKHNPNKPDVHDGTIIEE
ncbi:nucleoside diphosphate kinase homolog 5 isoform X1 [Pseudophryne corroboree]|uniref:nucleoside diphosphate kinase homolog 5 isoform X1 n=1 Tax=Pseudophryne corroboree TaxID=495146 RepID=UPI003081A5CE